MAESLRSFYVGKRVLITGHSGFKGGWLAEWLKALGSKVIGYALPPSTAPNLFDAADIATGMESVFGDVRDSDGVRRAMAEYAPEIVIHNAAQPLVRRSYREPIVTYATNVMGTAHVLDAAHSCRSVRAVVVVTTDKCYENREQREPYREGDRLGGRDPYSSSKACAELVTAAYRASYFGADDAAAVASARAGNVIGGGDWSEDRLVPDIVRAIASAMPVVIRNPAAIRPWQHVLDPVRGYLMLARSLYESGQSYAEAWNFGPGTGDAVTVGELVERLTTLWGKGEVVVQQDPNAPHEAQNLYLNCDKAADKLRWTPLLDLQKSLKWTVDWYRAYYADAGTAARITREQIGDYMQLLGEG